jgi:hypothetical protein
LIALLAGVLASLAGLSTQALAADADQPLSLILAGSIVSNDSSYSYVGYIRPIWGGQLGEGWFSVSTASVVTYRYSAGNGAALDPQTVTVHGTGPGLASGLGYGLKGTNYFLAFSTQLGFRDISLSPDLPAGAPTGTVFTAMPQVQARVNLTPELFGDLISNYTFGQHSSYTRLRLGWQPLEGFSAGLEGVAQHGPGYQSTQEGLFVAKDLIDGWAVGLNGGRELQVGSPAGEYIGVAVSRAF